MADATGILRGALGLGGLLMLVGWRSCCRSEQGARTDDHPYLANLADLLYPVTRCRIRSMAPWNNRCGGYVNTVKPDPVTDYAITLHAMMEMQRRGLDEATVRSVLSAPGQRRQVRLGRVVLQSRITLGAPSREYLVRVFVDVDRRPADVITVYLTSKIAKYWKEEE